MKRNGTVVQEEYKKPLFAYIGDTSIDIFHRPEVGLIKFLFDVFVWIFLVFVFSLFLLILQNIFLFDYPVIIVECTFLNDDPEFLSRANRLVELFVLIVLIVLVTIRDPISICMS